jgi:hypothetical protein
LLIAESPAILRVRRISMQQAQTMTLNEKLDTIVKTVELEEQGKFEEAKQFHNTIPLPPYMAKFLKDHIGLDALLKSGLNLSEAEAEYGSDFISR